MIQLIALIAPFAILALIGILAGLAWHFAQTAARREDKSERVAEQLADFENEIMREFDRAEKTIAGMSSQYETGAAPGPHAEMVYGQISWRPCITPPQAVAGCEDRDALPRGDGTRGFGQTGGASAPAPS